MTSKTHSFLKQNRSFLLLSLLYTAWALGFIWHASYIASDGKLYFALFDDAMISMRYAWNLSHGSGLVWNPGEYVEGYTNLLMTLLMALATWFFEKRYRPNWCVSQNSPLRSNPHLIRTTHEIGLTTAIAPIRGQ